MSLHFNVQYMFSFTQFFISLVRKVVICSFKHAYIEIDKYTNSLLLNYLNKKIFIYFRHLSQKELVSLRNPLISMEPCIDPFLAGCDSNDDTQINLQEWGSCLGLKYGMAIIAYK